MPQAAEAQITDYGMRDQQGSLFFTGGCHSGLLPIALGIEEYVWAINVVNRGGVLQTRMGYDMKLNLPPGNLQGGTSFRPTNSNKTYLVVAVDGKIYYSLPPFSAFLQIPGLQFYDKAPFVYFCKTIKALQQNPDGSLSEMDQLKMLIIQDGGYTRAAYWTGSTGRHLNPTPGIDETPIGSWMAWIGDRLWILQGSQLLVGDLADPLRFTEIDYLAEGLPLQLKDEGTGLAVSEDLKVLLAFTHDTTTIFQASNRDRPSWKTTPDFQKELFPNIGCVAGRSIVNQYGLLWWYSAGGLVNFNSAQQTYVNATVTYVDHEMARSKGNLSPLLHTMAGGSFENYLMMSVPSGDSLNNKHTWVMDQAVVGRKFTTSPAVWNGIWTGTRPMTWITDNFDNRARCFFLSKDLVEFEDTTNRLWEAFVDRVDGPDNPIDCWVETRMHTLGIGSRCKFKFAELYFIEIKGNVLFEIFWRGTRGTWKKIAHKEVISTPGPFWTNFYGPVEDGNFIQATKKQSRYIITDSVPDTADAEGGSGIVEDPARDNIDRGFSLMVHWQGQAALAGYRLSLDPYSDTSTGAPATQETEENEERVVFQDGKGLIFNL